MPTASRSFLFSLYYLAMFFLLLVSSSWSLEISFIGVIICIGIIFRLESDVRVRERPELIDFKFPMDSSTW